MGKQILIAAIVSAAVVALAITIREKQLVKQGRLAPKK